MGTCNYSVPFQGRARATSIYSPSVAVGALTVWRRRGLLDPEFNRFGSLFLRNAPRDGSQNRAL